MAEALPPRRGVRELATRPRLTREAAVNLILVVILVAAPVWAYADGQIYYVNLASRIAILAMAGVGLNLALGHGGMVSFGHAAFFGLGGYAAGIAATHALDGSLIFGFLPGTQSMPVIWIAGMVLAALAAIFIGAISLRTEGVYFIMITLAFAQMIYYFAISWPRYGGEDGLPIYVKNQFPGLDTYDPLSFFWLCLGALLVSLAVVWRIMLSRFGAALSMARLNQTRLATSGVAPFPVKLTAFVISAMITGWAGALYADLNGFTGPSSMAWSRSGEIMVFVILGGVGRLFGPLAGAALFVLLETFIGAETERWGLFLGLILLGVVLFARNGVIGVLAGKARHD